MSLRKTLSLIMAASLIGNAYEKNEIMNSLRGNNLGNLPNQRQRRKQWRQCPQSRPR